MLLSFKNASLKIMKTVIFGSFYPFWRKVKNKTTKFKASKSVDFGVAKSRNRAKSSNTSLSQSKSLSCHFSSWHLFGVAKSRRARITVGPISTQYFSVNVRQWNFHSKMTNIISKLHAKLNFGIFCYSLRWLKNVWKFWSESCISRRHRVE